MNQTRTRHYLQHTANLQTRRLQLCLYIIANYDNIANYARYRLSKGSCKQALR